MNVILLYILVGFLVLLSLTFYILFYISFSKHKKLKANVRITRRILDEVVNQSGVIYWDCVFGEDEEFENEDEKRKRFQFGTQKFNIVQGWLDAGIIIENYRKIYQDAINQILIGQEVVDFDLPLTIKSPSTLQDTIRWKHIVYKETSRSADGKIVNVVGVAKDITSRKHDELEYEGLIEYQSSHYRTLPAFSRLNLTKNIVMERFITIPEINKKIKFNVADDELSIYAKLLEGTESGLLFAKGLERRELLLAHINGLRKKDFTFPMTISGSSLVWFKITIEMIVNPYSEDVEAFIVLEDVTAKKYAELAKNAVIDDIVEYVFWVNTTNGIARIVRKDNTNEWIPDEKEIPYSELVEDMIIKTASENEKKNLKGNFDLEKIQKQLAKNDIITFNYHVPTDDKDLVKCERVFYLDEQKNAIVFICRDVSSITLFEQKKNEELEQVMRRLDKANNAKSEFLSRMSHDLRTPMNGIIGFTDLAEKEIEDINAVKRNIRKIKMSSEYMLDLLNDILDMSKIESGKLSISLKPTEVENMVDTLLMFGTSECEKKGIKFSCNVKELKLKGKYFMMDELHVKQILMNLISNAIKFTPENGHIEVELKKIAETDTTANAQVIIRDSGIGMSDDFQKIMFDPFMQDPNSGNGTGTGLGLTIVRCLVELMNGKIECKSSLGEGTEFIIQLPFDKVDKKDLPKKAKIKKEKDPISLKGKKILVVEDNALNQEIALRLLEKEKIIVKLANNGLEALDIISDSKPDSFDAIFMDMRMPIMDGVEATKHLRQLEEKTGTHVPIIAMTANAFSDDIERCLSAGMDAHIAKPISIENITKTLQLFLK